MVGSHRLSGIGRGVLGAVPGAVPGASLGVGLGAIALFAALAMATPAGALSIVDIVQLSQNNYSEEAIIKLIDVTSSAFELEAEDVPRLKELGVSEAVIRVMLERVPAASGDAGNDEQSEDGS